MNMFVIIFAVMAVASCAPSAYEELAARRALPALEFEEIQDEFGQFALRYVTAEGTVVSERGWLVPTPSGDYVLITEGEFSYVGDDGKLYVTKFRADLDGMHVEGKHLPVAPKPIAPEEPVQPEPQ